MRRIARKPAHRITISDLHKSEYIQTNEEYEPNYILTEYAQEVSRLKTIGTVSDSPRYFEESGYSVMLFDDGTDTVSCFAYRENASFLDNIEKGDLVQLIARVNEWEGEKRLTIETVSRLSDPNWLTYHILATHIAKKSAKEQYLLAKQILDSNSDIRDAKTKAKQMNIDPDIISTISEIKEKDKTDVDRKNAAVEDSSIEKVKEVLNECDDGNGVSIAVLREKCPSFNEEEIKSILKELLKTGDVFEPKVGHFSLVLY